MSLNAPQKNLLQTFGLVIASAALSGIVTVQVLRAYECPTHLVLTMHVARLAGFPVDDAFEIAKYDQGVDDNPDTSPMRLSIDQKALDQRAEYHFVNPARQAFLRADAEVCAPLGGRQEHYRRLGRYMHAFEDSYAHRGFEPTIGHLFAGHGPDKPWYNPAAFVQMAANKFAALSAVRAKCGPGSKQPTSQTAFEPTRKILESWSKAEYDSGALGDARGPERWASAEKQLYGSEWAAYTGIWTQRYEAWRAAQERNGWRQQ